MKVQKWIKFEPKVDLTFWPTRNWCIALVQQKMKIILLKIEEKWRIWVLTQTIAYPSQVYYIQTWCENFMSLLQLTSEWQPFFQITLKFSKNQKLAPTTHWVEVHPTFLFKRHLLPLEIWFQKLESRIRILQKTKLVLVFNST